MNEAQIHLALNHAPLFLSLLGGITLIIAIVKKNKAFRNYSFALLVCASIFTLPVYFTGEGAEELVEHLPGTNESAIEAHEEMAKISLIIIIVTGIFSLPGLLFRKENRATRLLPFIVLLLSLVSFGAMAQTAHLGGKIRHSELGNVAAGQGEEDKEKESPGKKMNDKDDD